MQTVEKMATLEAMQQGWAALDERLEGKLVQLNRLLHHFADVPSEHKLEEGKEVGSQSSSLQPVRSLCSTMFTVGRIFERFLDAQCLHNLCSITQLVCRTVTMYF